MHYIYKFLNEKDEIIYIGSTNNITTRIKAQHFNGFGHLPNKCYEEVFLVLYSECVSIDDAKVKERYLINKLSPKYNDKLNNNSIFSFNIEISNWEYMPINKENLLKKIKKVERNSLKNVNIQHTMKEYSSLDKDKLKIFTIIPCEATLLKKIEAPFEPYKISVIKINNLVWTFLDQIRKIILFSISPSTATTIIKLINKNIIINTSVGITTDELIIKNNTYSNIIGYNNKKVYAKSTVLIELNGIQNIIDYYKSEILKKDLKQLEKKQKIKFSGYSQNEYIRDELFYNIDDFIDFNIKHNTHLGEILKNIKTMENLFKRYID